MLSASGVIGLAVFNKLSNSIRYLVFFSLVAGVTELVTYVLFINKVNNLLLFYIYPPVEFLILGLLYRKSLGKQYYSALNWTILFYLCFSLLLVVFFQSNNPFNTYGRSLENLLLVGLALLYFFNQLSYESEFPALSQPLFWINVGVLIYFSVNLLFFSMNNYLLKYFSLEENQAFWGFHAILSLFQYICFSLAILIEWKNKK